MGTNETTANKAAIGAAIGSLVLWLAAGYLPDVLTETMPSEAITVLVTWLFCRFVPAGTSGGGVVRGAGGLLFAAVFLMGCSTGGFLVQRCGEYQLVFNATQAAALDAKRAGLLTGGALDAVRAGSAVGTAAGAACLQAAEAGNARAVDAAIAEMSSAAATLGAAAVGESMPNGGGSDE